jgi:hypothetical protein
MHRGPVHGSDLENVCAQVGLEVAEYPGRLLAGEALGFVLRTQPDVQTQGLTELKQQQTGNG